ncbi:MAG: hypothetical protein HOE48_13415 [Candidatus Latescibacteria bacterium]|jgi:hypothetical protein|nr:hypothetical protein [Candidatus Latescibacterota bacterium]MBT5831257.1 hypothetical protein [Candidatus Latescibacterota bacterium]
MTKYLLGFIGLVTLFLGFSPLAIETKTYYFQTYSFYLTFISITIWFWTLLPKTISKKSISSHMPASILACIFIVFISILSPPHLRILYDETNLIGVSQAMFEHNTCYIPTQALFHNQNTYIIDHEWGIRPFVFPFFLYLIHLTKGYALSNVYLLNISAGLLTLFSFYLLLQRFFSKPLAVLGMGLLSAYPIFVFWTTSGGFEIVNLGFAIFAFYQFHCLLTSKEPLQTTRLIFTLILLAQIRYEAVLFLCTIGPFIVWQCIKHAHSRPHTIAIVAPILLLPVAWQRTLHSGDQAFMVQEGASMFGINHFLTNIQHAYAFFSGTESAYGTIPILFYISILGTLIGIIHLIRNHKQVPHTTLIFIFAATIACLLQASAILGYILGNLTRPFSIRLGIIFLPFLITPIIYLCHLITNKKNIFIAPFTLATTVIIFWGWSVASKNTPIQNLRLYQINQAYTDFFQEQDPQKQALIISPYSRCFVPDQRSAITFNYANQNWQEIMGHLQNGTVNKIYICQIADAQTKTPHNNTRLTHNARLNPLTELQIGADIFRISQISPQK